MSLLGRQVRVLNPEWGDAEGNVIAQNGDEYIVDLDGHEEPFAAAELEPIPAPPSRWQVFFEWLFTKGVQYMAVATLVFIVARLAHLWGAR